MNVFTKNQEITDTVKGNLSLMRLKHPNVCSTCSVSTLQLQVPELPRTFLNMPYCSQLLQIT